MNCQLNVTVATFQGHDKRVSWRATNRYGTIFYLCAGCVRSYRKKNLESSKGIKFEKLSKEEIRTLDHNLSATRTLFSYQPGG